MSPGNSALDTQLILWNPDLGDTYASWLLECNSKPKMGDFSEVPLAECGINIINIQSQSVLTFSIVSCKTVIRVSQTQQVYNYVPEAIREK